MDLTTRTFTSITPDLLRDWTTLWENTPLAGYSNAPAWFLAVQETFPNLKCMYIAMYDTHRLQAIIPLVRQRKYGMNLLGVFPEDFVCGIPFLLANENPHLLSAVNHVITTLDTLSLTNIPQSFAQQIQTSFPKAVVIENAVNYSLRLTKDNDNRIIIPQRSVLMRRVRDKEADFTLRYFSGTTAEGLAIAFAIDEESRKKSRGYNVFSDPNIKAFYQSLARYFQKHFTVNVLYYQEKPIAYEIGFVVGRTYLGNQVAFLADYAQYSPGKVLAVRLLESFASRDIDVIDFGSGDSHIKHLLTKDFQQLYRVIISKHILVQNYLAMVYKLKHAGYDMLHKNKKMYRVYKAVRNLSFSFPL